MAKSNLPASEEGEGVGAGSFWNNFWISFSRRNRSAPCAPIRSTRPTPSAYASLVSDASGGRLITHATCAPSAGGPRTPGTRARNAGRDLAPSPASTPAPYTSNLSGHSSACSSIARGPTSQGRWAASCLKRSETASTARRGQALCTAP